MRNPPWSLNYPLLLTHTRLIPKADRKKIHEYLFRGMHSPIP